ncbi:hypothetical protein [Haloarchaeobius sp. HME9146]|uniref:hypothetical protein n=1 Tax=Haloarchaeobius sp. HME9146 TaxID=2978732 RepID=UPI0021BF181B|nr:hypothetical protein [Haloarchaeobius sp. HME9146]MCT9097915.1 hypothetical protein [Haloarchaeobius sp. HME9146]
MPIQIPNISASLLQAIASLLSVMLSGILVFLYYKLLNKQREHSDILSKQVEVQQDQVEIQAEQTKIMENQVAFMEGENKPLIKIEDKKTTEYDGEYLRFTLSNHGTSICKRLDIQNQVFIPVREPEEESEKMRVLEDGGIYQPLHMIADFDFGISLSVLRENKNDSNTAIVYPGTENEQFYAEPRYTVNEGDDGEYYEFTFSEMVDYLHAKGFDTAVFQWMLLYQSMSENTYSQFVAATKVNTAENTSLEEAAETGSYPIDYTNRLGISTYRTREV